ncbi:hypothetical protein P3S67_013126 [Capsicum chacoense]
MKQTVCGFNCLIPFCEPLVDSHDHSIIRYKDEEREQEGEPACKIRWKVSKSHRNTHILRKLISAFIKEIVEGMIGYVCLPRIILKLLSDKVISNLLYWGCLEHMILRGGFWIPLNL